MKNYISLFCFLLGCIISAQSSDDMAFIMRRKDDSLRSIVRIDSLQKIISKDFHNYNAIAQYFEEKEGFNLGESQSFKYFDSLFSLIEKDKNIRPEYFKMKARLFYSRGEERANIFKKAYVKFPDNFEINLELGEYYHNMFLETSNDKSKTKFADSALVHLEKSLNSVKFINEKYKIGVLLLQLYYFKKDTNHISFLNEEIINKPYKGIKLKAYPQFKSIAENPEAKYITLSILNDIDNVDNMKNEFEIQNSNTYFNFVLVRSFFKPMLFSLKEVNGKYLLEYKVSSNADVISQPFEIKKTNISAKEYNKFLQILTTENLEKSNITLNNGYDGSMWYLESKINNNHNLSSIWAPNVGYKTKSSQNAMVNACLYLLKLSKIKTKPYQLNSIDFKYDPAEKDGYMIF